MVPRTFIVVQQEHWRENTGTWEHAVSCSHTKALRNFVSEAYLRARVVGKNVNSKRLTYHVPR